MRHVFHVCFFAIFSVVDSACHYVFNALPPLGAVTGVVNRVMVPPPFFGDLDVGGGDVM